MKIEIRGVNFRNKGAELMLHAALANARPPGGEATYALHERAGTQAQRRALGLLTIRWKNASRIPAAAAIHNRLPAVLPGFIRRRMDLVAASEVDAVLDASGFAYGDLWGAWKSEAAANYYEGLKRRGAKIILLPQQLGPFEDAATRDQFRRVLRVADLVFARDSISYESVAALGDGGNLWQAPDFTVSVPGRVPSYFEGVERAACLVPNQQMVAKAEPEAAAAYRRFLATAARALLDHDLDLYLLIHDDSAGDVVLAEQVRADLSLDIPILREPDPRVVKGILSRCHVTVGSRFHGLVSALSYGVPSLGTGWSHKYQMLFEDFGCAECLVSPSDPEEQLRASVARIVEGAGREEIITGLQAGRARYLRESEAVWEKVNRVLAGEVVAVGDRTTASPVHEH